MTKRSESFFAAFAVCSASLRTSRSDAAKASEPFRDSVGLRAELDAEKVRADSRIFWDASLRPESRLLFSTETLTYASPALILLIK